jgi:hypothetical protein
VALGGVTARNGEKCVQQILHEFLSLHPTLIFLRLSENDVLNCNSSSLSQLTVDLIRRLLSIVEVQYIAISQLLPFLVMNEVQKKVVGEMNGQLKEIVMQTSKLFTGTTGVDFGIVIMELCMTEKESI